MLESFARYAGAGAIGTTVHYAVLVLLVEIMRLSPTLAAASGAAAGATVNYLLNYRFTFRSTVSHQLSIPRFAFVSLAGIAVSSTVVFVFVQLGAYYLFGQVFATLLVLLLGFLANLFWTFSESSNDEPSV
jgi:putative flippase GtrA